MFWTISGYICLFITFGAIAGVGWGYLSFCGKYNAQNVKLAKDGRIVKAWVVMANDRIYKRGHPEDVAPAVVVCTFEEMDDLDDFLEDVVRRLKGFEQKDPDSPEEKHIESVMEGHIPYPHPLRIPKRITGGPEAWFVDAGISRSLLPEKRLTLPYIYIKIWVGEKYDEGTAKMIPYPDRRR